jgi:hypothetical protein
VYLLLVAAINLARRPFVLSGGRETLALCLTAAGMIWVGPVDLLAPLAVVDTYGPYVWLILGLLYGLCALLWALIERPRLSIYNASLNAVRDALAETAPTIDPAVRFDEDAWHFPTLGVQLHLDGFPAMRHVTLTSIGERQSLQGWWILEQALRPALASRAARPNLGGAALFVLGLALLVGIGWMVAARPLEMQQELAELLRL